MNTEQLINHSEGFRPSHFGELSACIHHERTEGAPSEARERGLGTHGRIAELLLASIFSLRDTGRLPDLSGFPDFKDEPPEVQWAIGLVQDYVKEGWKIFAVEQSVDILNEFGEKISQGTIDLVLERNGEFLIIDWKTGDKGNHSLQIHAYGAAWMDLHPDSEKVQGLLAYVDLRETVPVYLSYSLSSTQVLLLYDRWKEKERHEYNIGSQCDWCGIRGSCPAWAKAATAAFDKVNSLTLNPATGLPQGGNLVPAAVTGLKNDPARLEEFVLAWERAKTLVETDWGLKEALKTHMQTGFKAEHHILVVVKDKSEIVKSVDSEEFLEKVAHHVGYMQAAPAITVDPDKADEVWRGFYGYGEDAKFPVEIKESIIQKPGYSYIRAKGKPGAGDARKKRKELE